MVVALHPTIMDSLEASSHSREEGWMDILHDAPTNDRQELTMASVACTIPGDPQLAP